MTEAVTRAPGPAAEAVQAELIGALAQTLADRTPDPEAALAGARRFLSAAGGGVQATLAADPSLIEALLAIFANSQYLTETLVQSPELLAELELARRENRGRTRDEWAASLADFTAGLPVPERGTGLARFKRRQQLRIVWRDLQGLATLAETTQELSHLADAILGQAYAWAWNDLAGRFGTPLTAAGDGAELAVLGLGKLGGEELNYSSDIDLMFCYSAGGETAGGERATTNREFFTRLAQAIGHYVAGVTAEGAAYRLDLRLRPGGREGELALSLEAAVRYYRSQAREWELQMLIRARPCAGARGLAQRLLDEARANIYPERPDRATIAAGVRLSRQRIQAQLLHHRAVGRRRPELDVKLDAGGIRDIEFLIQFLQRLHGGAHPWVRGGNTLVAMQRLHDKGLVSTHEMQLLSSAYWLLRQLEHRLQLRMGQQTHTLPQQPERLRALARSLGAAEGGRLASAVGAWSSAPGVDLAGELAQLLSRRMAEVQGLYEAYLGQDLVAAGAPAPALDRGVPAPAATEAWHRRWERELDLSRHGQRQWQRLLRSAATTPEGEAALTQLSAAARSRLRLALEHSDWMAEALARRPQLAAMLEPEAEPEVLSGTPVPGRSGELDPAAFAAGMARLRLWRQQRTLQLLCEEWENPPGIAATLRRHTGLALEILAAALIWSRPAAPPVASFAVLGLGRLGLGELDLLSDLDLVFVSSDGQREVANRLAAKLIEVLTAYTQQGSLYAVDTRLRPGGREGELVQTPASLAAYFSRQAGFWEAFSYLKARPVAGDRSWGEQAAMAVTEASLRRFAGDAVEPGALAELRQRMEEAGRPGRWGLKTPPGGYYDVDFIVSRRGLAAGRGAPGSVGDPAGGPVGLAGAARALAPDLLPADTAAELAHLTEFLRAADHALRAATGKAGAEVPGAGEPLARAAQWLQRTYVQPWPRGPETAGPEPDFAAAVAAARARIRELYLEWC